MTGLYFDSAGVTLEKEARLPNFIIHYRGATAVGTWMGVLPENTSLGQRGCTRPHAGASRI